MSFAYLLEIFLFTTFGTNIFLHFVICSLFLIQKFTCARFLYIYFYCYSITVVCIFLPPFPPHPSQTHLPPLLYCWYLMLGHWLHKIFDFWLQRNVPTPLKSARAQPSSARTVEVIAVVPGIRTILQHPSSKR